MASKIKQLKSYDSVDTVYPVTVADAVFVNQSTTLDSKLEDIDTRLNAKVPLPSDVLMQSSADDVTLEYSGDNLHIKDGGVGMVKCDSKVLEKLNGVDVQSLLSGETITITNTTIDKLLEEQYYLGILAEDHDSKTVYTLKLILDAENGKGLFVHVNETATWSTDPLGQSDYAITNGFIIPVSITEGSTDVVLSSPKTDSVTLEEIISVVDGFWQHTRDGIPSGLFS